MLVLRCTRKLLRRLVAADGPAPSLTWLCDWYANPVSVGRARLILCVSESTLLPVIMPARDLRSFAPRLATAAGEVLRALGIADTLVGAEIDRMTPVAFAPTKSRVVLCVGDVRYDAVRQSSDGTPGWEHRNSMDRSSRSSCSTWSR